jgi:N-acetylglutamate synthase-like GNAT family acetyltransferase
MPSFPLEDCFVATVDGTVRGVGGYRILSTTEAKTTLLAVAPKFAALGLGMLLQDKRLKHLRDSGIRTVTTNTDDPRVERWLVREYGFIRTGSLVPKITDFGRKDADHWVSLRLELE